MRHFWNQIILDLNLLIYIVTLLCLGSSLSSFTYRWHQRAEYEWKSEAHDFLELPFYAPKPLSFVLGRSCCPKCHHKLSALDLIPLLSYVFSKGRCRYCTKEISLRYTIIELITVLFLVPLYFLPISPLEWFILSIIIMALICAMIIDAEHYWLPDECAFIVVGFATYYFYINDHQALLPNIAVAILSYLSIYCLRALFLRFRDIEAIGLGDAKLLAALTYWLGSASYSNILLIASFAGLIWAILTRKTKGEKIPFGPFLIAGAVLYFYVEQFR